MTLASCVPETQPRAASRAVCRTLGTLMHTGEVVGANGPDTRAHACAATPPTRATHVGAGEEGSVGVEVAVGGSAGAPHLRRASEPGILTCVGERSIHKISLRYAFV